MATSNDGHDDGRMDRDREHEKPPQSPRRPEHIAQQEQRRDAESFDEAADYQAQPHQDMPERARVTGTGTAERSERAAGAREHEHHAEDAQRAFAESHGDRQRRDRGDAGGSNR